MQSLPALSLSSFELPSRRSVPITWSAPSRGLSRSSAPDPATDYVEAVSVEVLPAANEPAPWGPTRTQAALRLYTSIAKNHEQARVSLHVIA
jgi:hypothetical protein